jgi:hypothetical protein
MKMKHLIFAMLTLATASSFTGCNDSTPDPKTPEIPCVTCEDEHTISEIINYEGVIVAGLKLKLQGKDTVLRAISISKDPFTFSKDSVLVPCPNLSEEFQTLGEKVIISGHIKSCDELLTHPNVHTTYGRKFDLKNIKKR